MHIVAVLRLVADIGGEVEIAGDGRDIDREWIDLKLNEFDDHALEEALHLKEGSGARVTAIAFDGDGADRVLQTALARGADQAFKLAAGDSSLNSRSMALAVAAVVRDLGAELVVTGVQTPEDVFGELAPILAATLDWPQASAVSGVTPDGDAIIARQEFSAGISATLRLPLPAVVGIQTASRPIRYVAGSKLRQAMAEKISLLDAPVPMAAPQAEIVGVQLPADNGSAIMIDGDASAIAAGIYELLAGRTLLKR